MGHTSLLQLRSGFGTGGLQVLALSGLLLSSLVGCGGGNDGEKDGPAPGTSSVVEKVELDGFLLVMNGGGLGSSKLRLLDTETGKASADSLDLHASPNPATHYSVSPNGRQIVFWSSTDSLKIADITFEGGVPGFEIVRELTGADYSRPRYTPDGLRILTVNDAIDPATGDTWPCSDKEQARYPLVALPGGHRYVCQETSELKEDGDVLASGVGLSAVSADGQFSDLGTHAPSGTQREIKNQPVSASTQLDARTPLPDGTFLELYGSASGEAVAESPAGFVTVYERIKIDSAQRDGRFFDLKASFETGDWDKAETKAWPMKDAGFPLLTEGDGRSTGLVGVSQDGQRALFASGAWIIVQDRYTNVLTQQGIESALSVVDRDGKIEQTFRTSSTGQVAILGGPIERDVEGAVLFQPELFQNATLVDFGDGNMLIPVTGNGLVHTGWGGLFDGKPYVQQNVGRMSRDGRWFFVAGDALSATDLRLCLTRVGSTNKECLSTNVGGEPVGIVGYGLKPGHIEDAPEILATSRTAAWPGSSVTVFGVRFGESGALRIGDAEVAESDIVEWADDHVVFTVAEDLPKAGQIVVETAQGKGGTARQFWLHQTELLETPFNGIHVGAIPLGQGLNVVDLGAYEPDPSAPVDTMFSPRTRLDTGEYVVFSEGSAEPVTNEIKLTSGAYTHTVYFELENRLADDSKWQLVGRGLSFDLTQQYPGFRQIAGDLVEHALGVHPIVAERVALPGFANRIPGTVAASFGQPDYFREGEDGKSALVINKVGTVAKELVKVLDWQAQPDWGTPTFAPAPRASLSQFIHGVEAAGQVQVLTGWDALGGTGKAGFQLSTDGGVTFGAMTLVDETLGNPQSLLAEPIRVAAQASTFFLVLESLGGGDVAGVHAISTAGVVTKGIAEVPSGAGLPTGLAPPKATLNYVNVGGKLLVHFPLSHTLVATDFDAAGAAPKAWTVLPSAADAAHVLNIWQDPKDAVVYAVKDDGTVLSSPGDAFDDPAAWEAVDLGIELALPTIVQPLAVSRLEDGRWFVLANLNDAKTPTEESPFGVSGFLIGPKP